jgi:predicted small metal-binding protein
MKTLTCKEMGGPCDAQISANSSDEMMANGMKHMEEAHEAMAADIKAMPHDDPKMIEWSKTFMEMWNKTPDSN